MPTSTHLLCLLLVLAVAPANTGALRFVGNGVAAPGLDRGKIPIDAPAVPADVGAGDFTPELWLRADPARLSAGPCVSGGIGWRNGHIAVDRDIYGGGDYGDYGLVVFTDAIAFGIETGAAATDALASYIDGTLRANASGPAGDASYRNGRTSVFPASVPTLVLGAEKHDAGAAYPSLPGWSDELRLATRIRYAASFRPPRQAFGADANTAAPYHFDAAAGGALTDSALQAGGPSPGALEVGVMPARPVWSALTLITGATGRFVQVPLPLGAGAAAAGIFAGLAAFARRRR
jgi:hypothetical protein